MIKDTTTILFNIHKLELQIKKQKLLVKNGEIDIKRKKSKYLMALQILLCLTMPYLIQIQVEMPWLI